MSKHPTDTNISRRSFLKASGIAGVAGLASAVGLRPGEAEAEEIHKFLTEDVRDETDPDYLTDLPYSSSNGRLSVMVHSADERVVAAAQYAAKEYADRTPPEILVRLLWANDDNESPNDSKISVYGAGQHHGDVIAGNKRTSREIAKDVFATLHNARLSLLDPYLQNKKQQAELAFNN